MGNSDETFPSLRFEFGFLTATAIVAIKIPRPPNLTRVVLDVVPEDP